MPASRSGYICKPSLSADASMHNMKAGRSVLVPVAVSRINKLMFITNADNLATLELFSLKFYCFMIICNTNCMPSQGLAASCRTIQLTCSAPGSQLLNLLFNLLQAYVQQPRSIINTNITIVSNYYVVVTEDRGEVLTNLNTAFKRYLRLKNR